MLYAIRSYAPLCIVATLWASLVALAEELQTVAITVGADNQLVVETSTASGSLERLTRKGLLIEKNGRSESWSPLPRNTNSPTASPASDLASLAGNVRGGSTSNEQAVVLSTVQLDQLASGEVLRAAGAGGFMTPADDAVLLNGKITIRRLPRDEQPAYPADECVLFKGSTELVRIRFPEGQSNLTWQDVARHDKRLTDGLEPGKYLIQLIAPDDESVFEIAAVELAAQVRRPIEGLYQQLSATNRPLADQILVETLLRASDSDGHPTPYFADAYDILDGSDLSPHLMHLRDELSHTLRGTNPEEPPAGDGVDPAIGLARHFLARGQWDEAIDALDSPSLASDARSRNLALLYRAVILAESGSATGDVAESMFQAAVEGTENAAAEDRYRAHNNFGNFLLRRVQDRLYNHSFRAASGKANTMFDALVDWQRGREQYEQALDLSQQVGPSAAAAARVNLARHLAVLADVIHVLNSAIPETDRFIEGETFATAQAQGLAENAAASDSGADAATRAAALETLAHLAHRQNRPEACRQHARQALEAYTEMGSLLGAEGIYRLLGLSYLAPGSSADEQKHALEHLQISHALAEYLRDQFPSDTIGLSRAGFLARRAYVNERIIELLLEQSRFAEALRFHEAAKARSLQDVLLADGIAATTGIASGEPVELLADWPEGIVALEYFLGHKSAWVFYVSGKGEVTAYPLLDENAEPIEPARLIADIRTFLSQTEGAAAKMLRAASPTKPFDSSWQDDLHRFYRILLPEKLRSELAGQAEKQLVIVPQHILHYFPFAALVTERDTNKRGPLQSAMPKFWIESGIDIIYSPSLSAWKVLRDKSDQTATTVHAVGIATFSQAKPLPGVTQDLKHLREVFANRLQSVATGSRVTEQSLYDAMRQPGLTFVGTHGTNLPDEPLSSYLLCHGDSQNDGRLMAGEIYGAELATNVVVLSACYSGLADRSPLPGDDLFGIERALLQAGVSTVVDGVWDVYDETGSEIMHHFFQHFIAGQPTPRALASAQRDFLQARRLEGPGDPWIHPYFWAVYKASGSDLTRFDAQGGSATKD